MSRLIFAVPLVLSLVACGDDGGSVTPDAAVTIDAAPTSTLVEVNPCPTTADATVNTTDTANSYMPMLTTITQGQVVKFSTSLNHDVSPLPPMTDSMLVVGFNKTKCFRFTAPGTFKFKCTPHGFTGTITVN